MYSSRARSAFVDSSLPITEILVTLVSDATSFEEEMNVDFPSTRRTLALYTWSLSAWSMTLVYGKRQSGCDAQECYPSLPSGYYAHAT